jgi:hypothetical protein
MTNSNDIEQTILKLSTIYGFDFKEACLKLKTKCDKKSNIILPWTGHVCNDSCQGLKLYHRLFIQCSKQPKKNDIYCETCIKNKHKYGTVKDRLAVGILDYISPTNIKVVPYANVLEKLNITKEEVLREASLQNIIIPESQFEKTKTKRGRPKKQVIQVSDTESEDFADGKGSDPLIQPALKKRGRPKKEQKQVKIDIGNTENVELSDKTNTILINKEPIIVSDIKIKEIDYWISINTNKLYNKHTCAEIGYWNSAIEQIEELDI